VREKSIDAKQKERAPDSKSFELTRLVAERLSGAWLALNCANIFRESGLS
jgi:hypothetical protein